MQPGPQTDSSEVQSKGEKLMPDPTTNSTPSDAAAADSAVKNETLPTSPVSGTPPSAKPGPTIHIADEFGTAKRNMPPAKPLLITTAVVLVIVAIVAFFERAKPQGAGSLDNVAAVDLPGQNSVLVALTFTLRNTGKKSLWVHNVQGKVEAANGTSTGNAVSAVDFDRYYQAFPALKQDALTALSPEDKLQPGEEVKRTIMVSFPVSLDAFNQRKSVSVVVQPYDQPVPITLTK
jgi:hypothetical protein